MEKLNEEKLNLLQQTKSSFISQKENKDIVGFEIY